MHILKSPDFSHIQSCSSPLQGSLHSNLTQYLHPAQSPKFLDSSPLYQVWLGLLVVWWLKDELYVSAHPNSTLEGEKMNLVEVEEERPARFPIAPSQTLHYKISSQCFHNLNPFVFLMDSRVPGDLKPPFSISFVNSACCLTPHYLFFQFSHVYSAASMSGGRDSKSQQNKVAHGKNRV